MVLTIAFIFSAFFFGFVMCSIFSLRVTTKIIDKTRSDIAELCAEIADTHGAVKTAVSIRRKFLK
jgi:hypothetical protein